MRDRAMAIAEWTLYAAMVLVVVTLLFFRDPRAFINDYREFIRDNKK